MGKYWDRASGHGQTPMSEANGEEVSGTVEQAGGKYWARANGRTDTLPQTKGRARSAFESFGRSVRDTVVGKHDPAYSDTGTVFDQFRRDLHNPTANAATLGASDAQMGDVIQQTLGDNFIRRETDANGYEVFVTRGPDGEEQKGYVNKPGLDSQDLTRAIRGALPFAATGSAAAGVMRAAPLALQMAGQGATAGGTSLAGDVSLQGYGSEQGLEFEKAAFAAGGGVLGPVAGRIMDGVAARRAVAQLFDEKARSLTSKGLEAASRAGLDPSELSPEAARSFAKTYAMTGSISEAATRSAAEPFNIPVSRGQLTKRPDLLTQEEAMRRNLYGDNARQTMETFDRDQVRAVKEAALGTPIAGKIAPHRTPGERSLHSNPITLGSSVREGLDSAVEGARRGQNAAWAEVPRMQATSDALELLPDVIQKRLGDIVVDENTPIALKMDGTIAAFMRGEAPQASTQVVKNSPIKDIDRMRRRLLDLSRSQTSHEDRRAASAMYDAFNDWIEEASKRNLLSGDVEMAAKLKTARGFTREVKELFEPRDQRGQLTSGGQRLAKIFDGGRADSPEALLDSLLSAQGGKSVTQGTVSALRHIRQIFGRYAEPATGRAAWDDIRLAYWVRQVQGRNGELLGPQQMLSNLNTAFASQRSIIHTLYAPQEAAEMYRFMRALKAVSYKPPNASGSGYTAAAVAKKFFGKMWGAFGGNTFVGQLADDIVGASRRYGGVAARRAVNQRGALQQQHPITAAASSSGLSAVGRDRPSDRTLTGDRQP